MFGKPVLPISEDQVNTLTENLYLAFSMVFTLVTPLVAWFKNNYVTSKGQRQQEVLKQKGLTK